MSLLNVFAILCLQLSFALPLIYAKKVESLCGHGWTAFGQEKCFKAFKPKLNYVDAQSYCASHSKASCYFLAHLATVTSSEEQAFLLDFLSTQKQQFANGSFWLGAIKRGSEQSFSWASNGEELSTFTNWSPGRPSQRTDALDYCLQMTVNSSGLWSDEPCTEQKHILCERPPQLMLEKMHRTLIELKKTTSYEALTAASKLEKAISAASGVANEALTIASKFEKAISAASNVANKALTTASKLEKSTSAASGVANEALTTAKSAIDTATSKAENAIKVAVTKAVLAATDSTIPLGFIYVQLPKEKSPQEIWPSRMSWTDISSQYDSTFFRVAGSKAEAFGKYQEEFSPYIDEIQSSKCESYPKNECSNLKNFVWGAKISRTSSGSTEDIVTNSGYKYSGNYKNEKDNIYVGTIKFHTSGGEVRPRNMAVKVWKRTG